MSRDTLHGDVLQHFISKIKLMHNVDHDLMCVSNFIETVLNNIHQPGHFLHTSQLRQILAVLCTS